MGSRIGETGTLLASWLLLLLPLCKLLASSKAHCKSFSCENFPDCPPLPQPPLPAPGHDCASIFHALSALRLHCEHLTYCTTLQQFVCVPVFPAGLKAIQGQGWVLLIPGCGPNTYQPTWYLWVGEGMGRMRPGIAHFCPAFSLPWSTVALLLPKGADDHLEPVLGTLWWCQAVVLSSRPCMGISWSENQTTPESSWHWRMAW